MNPIIKDIAIITVTFAILLLIDQNMKPDFTIRGLVFIIGFITIFLFLHILVGS